MDAEQTIAEIECLERIFALPDARPLRPPTSRLRIDGTTNCWRIALGFVFGSGTASVADLGLQYPGYRKQNARPLSSSIRPIVPVSTLLLRRSNADIITASSSILTSSLR
jgi:hypothetical protein